MSLIVSVMIKGLALVDYILSYFVAINPVPVTSTGNALCGFECNVWNAEMTACGTGLITNALALVYGLVELAPDLMCALFAV